MASCDVSAGIALVTRVPSSYITERISSTPSHQSSLNGGSCVMASYDKRVTQSSSQKR